MKLLIVEDEAKIAAYLRKGLSESGFSVEVAADGEKGLHLAREGCFDLIVLDVMLPELDGFGVCEVLRKDPATASIPIVMVTAKAAEIDRILGLELGADDYITKPFSPRELVLRIKRIVQRGRTAEEDSGRFEFGDLLIDSSRHLVSWRGKQIDLTATEFKLLTILAQRAGRVQSRDQLLRDVWEYNSLVDTRTVDTHMRRLREKLGAAAKHLDTVRGVGYRFVEAA